VYWGEIILAGRAAKGGVLNKVLRARSVRPGDGKVISGMMQKVSPLHADLVDRLPEVIDHLAVEEAIIGTVVECIGSRGSPAKVVGSTILAFVSDGTADRYHSSPFPALSSFFLQQVGKGNTGPFLNRREQAEGNTGDGMQQVIIEFAVDPMDIRHPDFGGIMNELYSAHFQFERGYNVKAVFVEASADLEPLVVGTGMRPVKAFDLEGSNENIILPPGIGKRRCYYRVGREDMPFLAPSCAAAIIMTYMRPTFRFTPTEQRLLKRAVEGKTDEQIAEDIGISRDAVKQSWRAIYDHVTTVMPEILENDAEMVSGRGAEKRRHIIAYVRNNLQELKPHYMRRG
jgi:hypothetical protein